MTDFDPIRDRLENLLRQHRDLDDRISHLTGNPPFNELLVKRLKIHKLRLKDEIAAVESQLIPDIIA